MLNTNLNFIYQRPNRYIFPTFIFLLIFITGCFPEDQQYSIEMKPSDEGIERTISCSQNLSDQELEQIAKLYEKRINDYTFTGNFKQETPNDVGGAGFFISFNTKMGTTSFYSERFRGQDNIKKTLDDACIKVDSAIDLLIGWLEYEQKDEPNFPKLRTFCDKNLREDCKNIVYYCWTINVHENDNKESQQEPLWRIIHYILERGYLSPNDMIMVYSGSEEQILKVIRSLIADKLGYKDPKIANKHLAFLSNASTIKNSMEKYIATTDVYKKIREEERKDIIDPNAEIPDIDVSDVFHELGFTIDIFAPVQTVDVNLVCECKPFYTNGRWREQTNQVTWSEDIKKNFDLPTYLYACWSVPDKKFQKEHFGRTILNEENLFEYFIWRQVLDMEKSKEWDNFISNLKPTQNLDEKLVSFRFSDYKAENKKGDSEIEDLSEQLRTLILDGLKAQKEN